MKSKVRFSKKIVIFVIANVFIYTWVHLILSAICKVEIAPTVSIAFFSFCGVEAGILGYLKKDEQKEKQNDEFNEETDEP